MDVVVVESPAKAKAIGKYLGSAYTVLASFGHVSDLPAKEGSVRPEDDFALVYATGARARRALGAIRTALVRAERLILATDPDREGEAIAWEVLSWLAEKGALGDRAVHRVTFHEVTPEAVREAMAQPRALDMALVHAQQARRALDYLVGFNLSPVLWRKLPGARSAGRVQSVTLRLVCEREAAIESFTAREYWSVEARVMAGAGETFTARLTHLDGAELDRPALETETMAEQAAQRVRGAVLGVEAMEHTEARRPPTAPFTTSTLQQDASRRLGLGVQQTMRIAQTLYEGVDLGGEVAGLITYMRTDSVTLSKSALAQARRVVRGRFGAEYLPARARVFRAAARNAEEAHEAIRPTDFARSPESLEGRIDPEAAALYALIWKRALASQMTPARFDRMRVDIASARGDVVLTATGSVPTFDGYLRVYREGRDDDAPDDDAERRLPAMTIGEGVFASAVHTTQRFTPAPPRYTEAGLVRALEERGIGRPSTYAAIVGVLREREYVVLHKRRFVPTERGRVATAFLAAFFARWVAYEFTAGLERDLDRIAGGDVAWKGVLHAFWGDFDAALERAGALERSEIRAAIEGALAGFAFGPAAPAGERPCPACAEGQLRLKLGRRGAFVGCSNFPACRFTRPLAAGSTAGGDAADRAPKPLGEDPRTGLPITLRRGRYGLFVQRGEDAGAATVSVPKAMAPDEITADVARALLALPRKVGIHPASGKTVLAGIGRFGPWLRHGRTYVALPPDDDVLTIGLNRAVMLIAEKGG